MNKGVNGDVHFVPSFATAKWLFKERYYLLSHHQGTLIHVVVRATDRIHLMQSWFRLNEKSSPSDLSIGRVKLAKIGGLQHL